MQITKSSLINLQETQKVIGRIRLIQIMTSSKPLPKKSHGHGCAGYVVKTTLKYLKLMGWRSDYEKYKTTEEMWNNGYKSYSVGLFD